MRHLSCIRYLLFFALLEKACQKDPKKKWGRKERPVHLDEIYKKLKMSLKIQEI